MRISGITIPDNKRLEVGLTALFGVGRSRSKEILDKTGIDCNRKAHTLSTEEENAIRKYLEEYTLEGELKRKVNSDIKRLKDINSYRGTRHSKKLPARGQRTKVNSRTVRGNVRKTMGSGRRKTEKK
ncbi:MAG: 30S ribosomal protein S13 [Candidatus Paceibacterota bacterium]